MRTLGNGPRQNPVSDILDLMASRFPSDVEVEGNSTAYFNSHAQVHHTGVEPSISEV